MTASDTIMYAIKGGYKYCANIGRHHESNNVILIADLRFRLMSQKCFNPDCRGFRSDPWPIPQQVFELSAGVSVAMLWRMMTEFRTRCYLVSWMSLSEITESLLAVMMTVLTTRFWSKLWMKLSKNMQLQRCNDTCKQYWCSIPRADLGFPKMEKCHHRLTALMQTVLSA